MLVIIIYCCLFFSSSCLLVVYQPFLSLSGSYPIQFLEISPREPFRICFDRLPSQISPSGIRVSTVPPLLQSSSIVLFGGKGEVEGSGGAGEGRGEREREQYLFLHEIIQFYFVPVTGGERREVVVLCILLKEGSSICCRIPKILCSRILTKIRDKEGRHKEGRKWEVSCILFSLFLNLDLSSSKLGYTLTRAFAMFW